jgi:phosphatidylserine/phosphatidylglycerophosphate/cardiolipin synthase-like enzyme
VTATQPPSPIGYVSDAAAIAQVIRDLIEGARSSIVLQMYMFAGNGETEMLRRREGVFPYAHTVARWLIERRARSPELPIAVVLDTQTIDDARLTQNGAGAPLARALLAEAGIPVLHANLFGTRFDARRRFPPGARLHDGHWRGVPAEAFGRAQQRWQTWHNVEDHRKNLVIDEGAWGAVTSHNFIDVAADWHENLFVVGAPAAGALWGQARAALAAALELPQRLSAEQRARVTELAARPAAAAPATAATARLPRSPITPELRALGDPAAIPEPRPAAVCVLATSEIRPRLVAALAAAEPGDRIRAASTWFSDRELLDAFVAAAERGADVQLLTDDLHGLPLGAIPSWFVRRLANLRVIDRARGIRRAGFELRIHPSASGRMMHLKTAAILGRRGRTLIGGQANYTPNSFSGAWLETGLAITGADHANGVDHVIDAFLAQLDPLWRAAAPPRPAAPLAGAAHRALLSLVEKTVFRF